MFPVFGGGARRIQPAWFIGNRRMAFSIASNVAVCGESFWRPVFGSTKGGEKQGKRLGFGKQQRVHRHSMAACSICAKRLVKDALKVNVASLR